MAVAGDRTHRNPVAGTFKVGPTDLERMTSYTEVGDRRDLSFRFGDHPGAISRDIADRDAKCDHFCGYCFYQA